MLVVADRVKETSITQGTDTLILNGVLGAFQSFLDGIGDGNSTYYVIENNNNFEVGIGTYTQSNNSLSRDTILKSSNNNNHINLVGVSIVFCTYPASKAFFNDDYRLTNSRDPNPHTHPISGIINLQNELNSKQPSGNYANYIHTHYSSDILDFAMAVSSVAPPTTDASLLTTGTLNDARLSANVVFTDDARLSDARTPLAHNHIIAEVSGLQTALDSKQASGNYANLVHSHISSEITDFTNSVNGLVSGIYAPLNSPTFTGIPLTPTALSGTNTNQIASTSFVRTEISNLVASAPATLDTLNELALALGNDANFSTTITNSLANKANLSGANFTGSISSPSGSFTSILVNGVNVSLSGHSHSINDVNNLQTALDSKQPSGSYANASHMHEIADVSGLQTALDSKQPSGSYANAVHTHVSSDITDFNSSVSGLLPVKNITAGTGIIVSNTTGNFTINSNQEALSLYTTAFNNTASQINKLSVVYINGGQGDQPTLALSIANGEVSSSKTYGVVAENIPSMSSGKVIAFGSLTGVNTDQFNPSAPVGNINGTILWLSPTVSGGMTTTKPSAPDHMVAIGTVTRTHQNAGIIEVRVQNGFELHELHNVLTNGVTDGQFLQYNTASGLWLASSSGNFNTLQVSGTSVSVDGHTHTSSNITDFNSSVSGLLSKRIAVFTASDNQPPASGFATLDTRNSILVLEFDATSDESAVFVGYIPDGAILTNGLKTRISWVADTATSGNVRWGVQFEADGTDLDSDSFDTATLATSAANGTNGIETIAEITSTSIDSLTVGDRFRLKIYRDADDATNDTMSGDAQLVAVEVRAV